MRLAQQLEGGKGQMTVSEDTRKEDLGEPVAGLGASASWFFLATIVSQSASFITFPLLSRKLGPSDYGVFSMILGVQSVFVTIALLGINTALVRRYVVARDDEERASLIGTAFLYVVAVALGVVALGAFVVPLASSRVHEIIPRSVAAAASFLIALSVLFEIALSTARAREKARQYAIGSCAYTAGSVVGVATLVVLLRLGVVGGLTALCLAYSLGIVAIARDIDLRTIRRFSAPHLVDMLRFGLPLVPMNLASWVLILSDRYILNWLTSTTDVGVYSAAYRVGGLVLVAVATPVNLAIAPVVFRLYQTRRFDRLFQLVNGATVVVLVAAGLLSFAGPVILRVLAGSQYIQGLAVVPVVACGTGLGGIASILATVMQAPGKNWISMLAFVCGGIVNVGINMMLIPRIGMYGAAWSTVVGYACAAGIIALALAKEVPNRSRWWLTSAITAIVVITYGALVSHGYSGSHTAWGEVGIATVATLAILGMVLISDRGTLQLMFGVARTVVGAVFVRVGRMQPKRGSQ